MIIIGFPERYIVTHSHPGTGAYKEKASDLTLMGRNSIMYHFETYLHFDEVYLCRLPPHFTSFKSKPNIEL